MHTYLIRHGDHETTVHTQRWLGDDLNLLYRGPTPDTGLRHAVDHACTGLAVTDDERGAAVDALQHRVDRYAELHVAEVTDLVRPGLQPAPGSVDSPHTSGQRYRLGIDDGQPGDCWLELGWDAQLGSFVGLEWARGVHGEILDVPMRWIGTHPAEHPTVTSLGDALGIRIASALHAQLVADQAAFPAVDIDQRRPGLDVAFADLIDLLDDWPRYEVTFHDDTAVVARYDWDGADPIHLGSGRWDDATIQSRIDADRPDPWYPPLGDGPVWYRLNDPDQQGSWRLAYEPRLDGFVACHVDETGEPVTDRRVGYLDRHTITPQLEADMGRPIPPALAASLRIDRNAFMHPDLHPTPETPPVGIDVT